MSEVSTVLFSLEKKMDSDPDGLVSPEDICDHFLIERSDWDKLFPTIVPIPTIAQEGPFDVGVFIFMALTKQFPDLQRARAEKLLGVICQQVFDELDLAKEGYVFVSDLETNGIPHLFPSKEATTDFVRLCGSQNGTLQLSNFTERMEEVVLGPKENWMALMNPTFASL